MLQTNDLYILQALNTFEGLTFGDLYIISHVTHMQELQLNAKPVD